MISIRSKNDSVKSTPSYGVICVLCLRTKTCTSVKSNPEYYNLQRKACVRYVTLVSKYFKLETCLTKYYEELRLRKHYLENEMGETNELVMEENTNKFTVCDSCLPLTESFCNNFETFEVLRMKMENNISETYKILDKSLLNVSNLDMDGGGKVFKRPKIQVNPVQGSSETDDILTAFRTKLRNGGQSATTSSSPRVCIDRNSKVDLLSKAKFINKVPQKYKIFVREICRDNVCDVSSDLNFNATSNSSTWVVDKEIEIVKEIPISNQDDPNKRNFTSQIKPVDQASAVFVAVDTPSTSTTAEYGAPIENTTCFSFLKTLEVVEKQMCKIDGCQLSLPKSTRGSLDMQKHLQTHTNWICQVCCAVIDNPLQYINHQLKHSKNDQPFGFICPLCGDFFSLRTEYKEHFLLKHLNSNISLLKCPICWKGYQHTNQKELRSHIANCHPENTEDLSNCHECDICHVYFRKLGSVWKHLKNDHRVNCETGNFMCKYCSKSYNLLNYLQMHKRFTCDKVPEGGLRVCPHPNCEFDCTTVKQLSVHLRQHGAELQLPECPICHVKYKDHRTMKYHLMTHNGEQIKLIMPNGQSINPNQSIVLPVQHQIVPLPLQQEETPVIVSTQTLAPPPPVFVPTVSFPVLPFAASEGPTEDIEQKPTLDDVETKVDQLPSTSLSTSFESFENVDAGLYSFFDEEDEEGNSSEHEGYFGQVKDDLLVDGVPISNEDPFAWIISDDSAM